MRSGEFRLAVLSLVEDLAADGLRLETELRVGCVVADVFDRLAGGDGSGEARWTRFDLEYGREIWYGRNVSEGPDSDVLVVPGWPAGFGSEEVHPLGRILEALGDYVGFPVSLRVLADIMALSPAA